VTRDEALARAAAGRVGRIATVRPDSTPHVVPLVFALVTDGAGVRLYWAVDHKPKRSAALARIANLRANPVAEVVVDAYDDNWTRLWWVRLGGTARVVEDAGERRAALEALAAKYPAYRTTPPEHEVVAIDVAHVRSWSASDA
jgi:PPOX class probable F420-dependent enzyme